MAAQLQVPELADKATEDIERVAAATSDATKQATQDVSKTIQDVAHDVEVHPHGPSLCMCSWEACAHPRSYTPSAFVCVIGGFIDKMCCCCRAGQC
jgi:hypothetical protein